MVILTVVALFFLRRSNGLQTTIRVGGAALAVKTGLADFTNDSGVAWQAWLHLAVEAWQRSPNENTYSSLRDAALALPSFRRDLAATKGKTTFIYFSPDGSALVRMSKHGVVEVWNRSLQKIDEFNEEGAELAAVSRNGQYVITVRSDSLFIACRDVTAKRTIWRYSGNEDGAYPSPEFRLIDDAANVMVYASKKHVFALDLHTGVPKWERHLHQESGGNASIDFFAFQPQRVLTGVTINGKHSVQIREAATGRVIEPGLNGGGAYVQTFAALSLDGETYALADCNSGLSAYTVRPNELIFRVPAREDLSCDEKMPPQRNLWVNSGSGSRPRL